MQCVCSFIRTSRFSADTSRVCSGPLTSIQLALCCCSQVAVVDLVPDVMKSDRYETVHTDISTSLFQCAKVWSLKG